MVARKAHDHTDLLLLLLIGLLVGDIRRWIDNLILWLGRHVTILFRNR